MFKHYLEEVEKKGVMEMDNFKYLIQRNEGIILNYFVNGDTNDKAEALNSKIQQFIMMTQGTIGRELFYFRLEILFFNTSN